MLTFQTTAKVAKNRCIDLHLPASVKEGEYRVLVTLEETSRRARAPLTFSTHRLGTTASETFHREELYSDDGR